MCAEEHTPEQITTQDWYLHTRRWQHEDDFDATARLLPAEAAAGQEGGWEMTVQLGAVGLEAGDHLAVEVSVGWRMDRGRPYVDGRWTFGPDRLPGYNPTPKFALGEGVDCEIAVSSERFRRYYIIDAVITKGSVAAGSTFRVFLADPVGSLVRCPWFAQDVPIPLAVRKKDDDLYRRLREIPTLHVKGSMPRLWKVAATLQPDHKQVRVQAIAADIENLNPAECTADPAVLECQGWEVSDLRREAGYHDAPVWRGTAGISGEAAPRIEVLSREKRLYGSSNAVVPDLYEGAQVYFGDLHGQSDRSIGFGTEREYFWWARDAELLDFAAPANHYGGRETFAQDLWHETLELCDEFNDSGKFATLYSCEWGVRGFQHRNIYYREKPGQAFTRKTPSVNSLPALWQQLEEQGLPVLTIPHHLKFIGGNAMDWTLWHGEYQRVVEVCSIWGNSERHGARSLDAGLRMGQRLGALGGTDTHFSQPGRPVEGPFGLGGVTAVICDELERKKIWDAVYARRCYATTGERILLDFRVDGELMGSDIPAGGVRRISGRVIGTAELESVEIIRNGETWKEIPTEGREAVAFELADADDLGTLALTPQVPVDGRFVFYYLRVVQRDRHWAMSSPIWVTL